MISPSESTASLEEPLSAFAFTGARPRRDPVERLRFKLFEPEPTRVAGDLTAERMSANTMADERDSVQSDAARRALDEQHHSEAVETARRSGREDGRSDAAHVYETQLSQQRRHILDCATRFAEQRSTYFAAAEAQVVQLSLAIAKRILHREVQLDPLLLRGVVRVALEKLEEETGTILRVPAEDLIAWQSLFAGDSARPVVIEGEASLKAGECSMETSLGKIELGVAAQLEEVEKSFFDLLQQRPVGR